MLWHYQNETYQETKIFICEICDKEDMPIEQ